MFRQLRTLLVSLSLFTLCSLAFAQNSQIQGQVSDPSGKVIPRALVRVVNQQTGTERKVETNGSGQYSVPGLDPSPYKVFVQAPGFSTAVSTPIILNVAQNAVLDFKLQVGQEAQTVTVDGNGLQMNVTDGSVSTVVDRNFVANIPLNGRSFQDLISLTPGVLTDSPQTTSQAPAGNGDFSINGQRTESNYYMVDGISANVSAKLPAGGYSGPAGVIAATSALGTTQSLLSVDDLQEFRVESSSYSAEYGRSPGGQLMFVTRSGTNLYHGTAYDYLRNGYFDANDWFNDHAGAPKQSLHQNDFGGTFGGPVWIPHSYKGMNKTFFFVSYEGLRLTQPTAATVQYVPDTYMRQQAPAALQPILNAFPQQSQHGVDYGTEESPSMAQFIQGYSLPGKIDSTSIRIDHTFTPRLSAFFRFADTPSSVETRQLSLVKPAQINTQASTLGVTYLLSSQITNQFHLGYAKGNSFTTSTMDSFGGATPVDLGKALGSTSGTTGKTLEALAELVVPGIGSGELDTEADAYKQHQWNLTDAVDVTRHNQQVKIGVDFRQISTTGIASPLIDVSYESVAQILTNTTHEAYLSKSNPSVPVFNQVALFVQDQWRISSRLSLSGGLRWELAPPPHNAESPQPYTVIGNVSQPSTLSLAPANTPLWKTSWYDFAPRLGLAWQVNTSRGKETVLRIGGGVFFDTSNQAALTGFSSVGFSASAEYSGVPVPLTPAQQDFSISVLPPYSAGVVAYPSHLQLPYTNQWNASIEQALGTGQTLSISYVGSAGRRLSAFQELSIAKLNPLFETLYFYPGGVTSDYDALQAKFQRSVGKGIGALASYTWSHSIDYGSNYSALPLTRGNSDFDVRSNFQGGLTWELPRVTSTTLVAHLLNSWGLDGRLLARTGFPITLRGTYETDPGTGSSYYTNVNFVAGQPIYLYGGQYPGGRALNKAAFADPTAGEPGNAPRNFVRGFGESQVNFAVRREFDVSEKMRFEFRAEAFNIFNHPNFGYVDPGLTDVTFGQATKMLDQSLGTVASQYQQGGPRSMQFMLKLVF